MTTNMGRITSWLEVGTVDIIKEYFLYGHAEVII